MQSIFLLDEDLNNPNKQFRPITSNEAIAYRRNKVEEHYLSKKLKIINLQSTIHYVEIRNNKKEIINAIKTINLNTGSHTSRKDKIKSAPGRMRKDSGKYSVFLFSWKCFLAAKNHNYRFFI
jgi:hypothetical protein